MLTSIVDTLPVLGSGPTFIAALQLQRRVLQHLVIMWYRCSRSSSLAENNNLLVIEDTVI